MPEFVKNVDLRVEAETVQDAEQLILEALESLAVESISVLTHEPAEELY